MYKVLCYLDQAWEVTDENENNLCLSSYELLDLIKDGRTSNCACVELNKSTYLILEDTTSKVRMYKFNGTEVTEVGAEIRNRLESSLDAFDFLTKRHNTLAEAYDILGCELKEEKRANKELKKKVKKLKKSKKKKTGARASTEVEQLKADYQNIKAELEAKAEEVKLLEKKLTEAELRISLDEQLMAENNIDLSLEAEQTADMTCDEQTVEAQEEQEEHDKFFADLGLNTDFIGELRGTGHV